HAAVHAHRGGGGQGAAPAPEPGQLRGAVHRPAVRPGLPQLDQDCGGLHRAVPADRLPDGLLHRADEAGHPQHRADGGGAAVVDLVPDPGLRLDRHPRRQRHPQPLPAVDRAGRRAAAHPLHPAGGLHRHRLLLPAVHDPAAVRQPGEARPPPAGGRLRPRCAAVEGVRAHHPAAVALGHHRRLHAGDDPDRGRVRDPGDARRPGHADDRPGAVGRVLQQPRLAGGLGGGDRDAAPAAGADPGLQPLPAAHPGGPAGMNDSLGMRMLRWAVLVLGFAFLYLPIVLLVVYSFNSSRLATVWAGFSVKWYGELMRDRQMLDAAWVSLRIAFWTATAATVIGTLGAMVMTRFRRFPGKTLFGALVT